MNQLQKNDTDKSDLEKKFNDADKKYLTLVGFFKKKQFIMIKLLKQKATCLVLLATTAALIAVDAEMSGIESKYFTLADCYKFTSQTLDANVKQKEFVDKSAIDGFINNADLNMKVAPLTTRAKLKGKQDKI